MRKISMIFMIIGLVFVVYSGFQIVKTKYTQNQNLAEAKEMLKNRENENNTNTPSTDQNNDTKDKKHDENTSLNTEALNFQPTEGDTVGILSIPKLEAELPILEGTEESVLSQGVGHYGGTGYPLQNDQIVLSGHRETVFRRLEELELGDILTVEMPYGEVSYEVTDLQIVDANDRSIIVPSAPDEKLTVTTCYPFTYVGDAPDRYIVTALPIENKDE